MTKYLKISLLLSVLIISIISGCLFNENDDDNNKNVWYQSGQYIIDITPNGMGKYNITLPVVVNQNGTVSNIMNNLKITEGDGEFKIINSEKGIALNVLSDSKIRFNADLEKYKGKDDIIWDILSLEKDTEYDGNVKTFKDDCNFFVLLENKTDVNSVEIEITFQTSESNSFSGSDAKSECSGIVYPNENWQLIKGYRGVECWDK